eukprot:scaffold68798_cov52-Attheya_sp.AAC.2
MEHSDKSVYQQFTTPPDYEYHHGTGRHMLMKPDSDVNRPHYSIYCCLCHLCDYCILAFILAFLGGAFYLCYYLYNNYD